jgi:hypothetical protein
MKRIGLIVLVGAVVLSCQQEEGGKPNLYSPKDGETVHHPTFIWESTGDEYELELSDDSTFATIKEVWYGLADTTYTPTDSLDEGFYYWRVRAMLNEWGEWSDIGSFSVVGPAWGLISPADADTVKFPTLVWNSIQGVDGYHLYVYQGMPEANRLVINENLVDTFWVIADTLDPATYRWCVSAVVGGHEIYYPDTFRFVTYTLDETYFPVGLNYVWDYQEIYSSWGRFGDVDDTTYYSIEVTEFTWGGDSLYVVLSDGHYFTGKEYIYKNDSVYFYCDRPALQSISLVPRSGEPMYDHESDQERPDLWAEMDSDTTFHWGDTWGNGGEPYHDYWIRECWQRGKGMYLFYEGESYHYNSPDEEHPNGEWISKDTLINLDKGE